MNRLAITLKAAKTAAAFFFTCGMVVSTPAYSAEVSQVPLLLGGGGVPGNLALVPSVEWPTLVSVANLGNYSSATTYVGYFDSFKCYTYDKAGEWFEPQSINTTRICGGSMQWSGNFLNWAATPTIDPFRSALTGGYRVRDEKNLTVLSKARNPGYDAGNRLSSGQGMIPKAEIPGATPAGTDWDNFYVYQQGLGTYINISNWADKLGTAANQVAEQVDYDPNNTRQWNNGKLRREYQQPVLLNVLFNQLKTVYRVNMRVRVCVPEMLESNCKQYPNGNHKPEGLIQQYSNTLRYSAFGYLNDSSATRDGGALRANQKFVGDRKITPNVGEQTNGNREWDPQTGVQFSNPDNITSAMGINITDSGVINYINKFGQLNNNMYKSNDPASELYYAAMRYFRNLGNVAAYTSNNNGSVSARTQWADNFPVITDWQDPIQYACQKNVILGIGDVNTWNDKNLPGNTNSSNEPSKPAEVIADTDINAVRATQTIFNLEGIGTSAAAENFTGRSNSAYIAGLAYLANTQDMRPNIAGKQTISTFWVDVRENQALEGKNRNQYWLAAKYGGFKVPNDFDADPYARTQALPEAWWRTTPDMLGTNYPRPDNFFVASDATRMVESLKIAFAKIAQEVNSTTTALATNSTRLATDTAVFQSSLDSKYWSGDLLAKKVNTNGTIDEAATWSAATKLDAMTVSTRKIFTPTPLAAANPTTNGSISNSATAFTWSSGIGSNLKDLLWTANEKAANNTTIAQNRLNYLRGDRSLERTNTNISQPFRQRSGRLGDIINSDPQFVANQDYGYTRLTGSGWSAARGAYAQFRSTTASRTPMVVVGANDGMLHGFNASMAENGNGGQELFAFVPNGIFANLINLTDPSYSHRYYVDGTPRVSDAWLGSGWKTIVAGTTGAGGKSVFVLDITDPANMSASKFLWEFSHPDMGAPIGQPAIVALPNGKFSVVVTSGYRNAEQNSAKIWFLDAANGSVLRTISLPTTGDLGSPLMVDLDGDQVAERLYVGDTKGNLWRVNLSGATASNWAAPTAPFFVAKDAGNNLQPITAPLSSAFNEKGQHMVLFGTGSFMNVGDNEIPTSPPMQSFYAIVDDGTTLTRSNLLAQEILSEVRTNSFQGRTVTNNELTDQKGWYLDLAWKSNRGGTGAQGERVISKAVLRTDRVTFTTMTPSKDPCASGGTSWIMALSLSSGSRLNYTYFDSNKDGKLDSSDDTTVDDDNIPISGISDPDIGVVKGATPLYRWLCYSGSAGAAPQCIKVAGSQRYGRNAWQEAR
ncbi:pilus assembly protein [Phytopseudomonas seleniipraecipitans]|uniref:Type IV pilus assembly protein PilY1 n=1 Tax=Phytopseudomonas seleniipraecipitans TaxID=640205 RepID=A0A1G7S791_9GAMM|nr:PilC/PilY family type IV pilus protein [Pseudomonas seleniipraecipitans]SDG18040.1 type IV pilus assembly protein PilY1 [Pseudomonas seleniipraecipitans]